MQVTGKSYSELRFAFLTKASLALIAVLAVPTAMILPFADYRVVIMANILIAATTGFAIVSGLETIECRHAMSRIEPLDGVLRTLFHAEHPQSDSLAQYLTWRASYFADHGSVLDILQFVRKHKKLPGIDALEHSTPLAVRHINTDAISVAA